MIAYLNGIVEEWGEDSVILDVGGVGYEVHMPTRTISVLARDRAALRVYTHEHLREDEHALYGFASRHDRDAFRMVLAVNGVGPRTALNVLSTMSSEQFAQAVQEGDVSALARVPGIGRKTAQKILLELQSRLGAIRAFVIGRAPSTDAAREAVDALVSLDAHEDAAHEAVGAALKELGPAASVQDLIRNALRRVGK
ncbi:Holliday junction branch migration protein RuvA [Candidatus Poribacteria bacterium]|nr:Holliday junction branch migration protein RuvA [Candidatus Poribacteria bacterium]